VSRIHVGTDGAASTAERIRTVVLRAYPTASVALATETTAAVPLFQEAERVVHLGLIGTMILAGCSLAVAVTTGMLDRRRQFALLRSAGMPVSRLAVMVMLQAAAPLVAVAACSALLGLVVAQSVLRLATSDFIPLPDAALLVTLGASVLGALAVVVLTLPPLERMTRPDAVRVE
jgi:predicted lysophospholipase L1 biosynthesis ABC-type transport system permease subunit